MTFQFPLQSKGYTEKKAKTNQQKNIAQMIEQGLYPCTAKAENVVGALSHN